MNEFDNIKTVKVYSVPKRCVLKYNAENQTYLLKVAYEDEEGEEYQAEISSNPYSDDFVDFKQLYEKCLKMYEILRDKKWRV